MTINGYSIDINDWTSMYKPDDDANVAGIQYSPILFKYWDDDIQPYCLMTYWLMTPMGHCIAKPVTGRDDIKL